MASVRRVRRRLLLDRVLSYGASGGAVGGMLALAIVVLMRMNEQEATLWAGVVLSSAGTVAGIVAAMVNSPDVLETTRRLDERYALRDRITTAVELSRPTSRRQDEAFAEFVRTDADRVARIIDAKSAAPIRFPMALIVVAVALGATWAVRELVPVPDTAAASAEQTPGGAVAEAAREVQEAAQALRELEQASRDVAAEVESDGPPEDVVRLEELAKQLTAAPEGSDDAARAAAELDELAAGMEERAQERESALDELARSFDGVKAPEGPMSAEEFMRALQEGRFGDASEVLEKIEQSGAQERAAAATAMEEAARRLSERLADSSATREERESAMRDALESMGLDEEALSALDDPATRDEAISQLEQSGALDTSDAAQLREALDRRDEAQREADSAESAQRELKEQMERSAQELRGETPEPPASAPQEASAGQERDAAASRPGESAGAGERRSDALQPTDGVKEQAIEGEGTGDAGREAQKGAAPQPRNPSESANPNGSRSERPSASGDTSQERQGGAEPTPQEQSSKEGSTPGSTPGSTQDSPKSPEGRASPEPSTRPADPKGATSSKPAEGGTNRAPSKNDASGEPGEGAKAGERKPDATDTKDAPTERATGTEAGPQPKPDAPTSQPGAHESAPGQGDSSSGAGEKREVKTPMTKPSDSSGAAKEPQPQPPPDGTQRGPAPKPDQQPQPGSDGAPTEAPSPDAQGTRPTPDPKTPGDQQGPPPSPSGRPNPDRSTSEDSTTEGAKPDGSKPDGAKPGGSPRPPKGAERPTGDGNESGNQGASTDKQDGPPMDGAPNGKPREGERSMNGAQEGAGSPQEGARAGKNRQGGSPQSWTDRLKDALRNREAQRNAAKGQREQAEKIRESARKAIEEMSPAERDELRRWVEKSMREQGGGGQGRGRGDLAAAPLGELGSESSPLEVKDDRQGENDQTLAEWLSDEPLSEDARTATSKGPSPSAIRRAQKSAERAVGESTVSKRYHRLMREYFERLDEDAPAESTPTSPGAGAAP